MSDDDKKAEDQEMPDNVHDIGVQTPRRGANIADTAPEMITRPLCIVAGEGYATTWVHTTDGDQSVSELVVVGRDGRLYSDGPIDGSEKLSDLNVTIKLADEPDADKLWSGEALKKYLMGERADPANLFRRMSAILDSFMDFDRSIIDDQKLISDFLACFAMSTYFTEDCNRSPGPKFVKIGRSVRYLIEDLDYWLEAHRVKRVSAE